MLSTVVLLLLCALIALAGVPLILRLVPRNEFFGVLTERALSHDRIWYDVNRFAGWALVAASALTLLALIAWSNTLLRPFWRQFLVFIVPLAIAVGATLWYERRAGTRPRRSKSRSRRSSKAAA